MTLGEAQNLSVSGVAVRGNVVMQDIIWPKGSSCAFGWVQDGYMPLEEGKMADKTDWEPLHRPRSVMQPQYSYPDVFK